MAAGEQSLIERYFTELGAPRADVLLGVGDDAALLRVERGMELAQTTDSLVEHVHFLPGAAPDSLGHRALAVNLSDLAAMGATPAWALLSLTLPRIDEAWIAAFAAGFARLARAHAVALVGGNLSRGALNITVQLTGQVAAGSALRRGGARAGELVWVSGTLGDAAAGRSAAARAGAGAQATADEAAQLAALRARFEYPTPRVALGCALRGIASACIDLSDGLASDLARLAAASGCGARLELEALPLSAALRAQAQRCCGQADWQLALSGGEDYELCFTAPAGRSAQLRELAARLQVPVQPCGRLLEAPGLALYREGAVMQFSQSGFDHFAP